MIVLNINHINYRQLLQDLSTALQIPYQQQDFLTLSAPSGEGVIKTISLFDELQVLLVDACFNERMITIRERSDNRYFILHFDDVFIKDTATLKVDDEQLQKSNTRHSVARLTSNIFVNTEELPANLHIKSVKVLFNEKWLKKYMDMDANDDVLQRYLSLKTESFDIEQLDAEYLRLMDELWTVQKDDPLQNIFLQNRVTLLIERFFTRLYSKTNLLEGKFNLSSEVINGLIKVEHELVNDFSKLPPTIDEFSKLISMSSTKLKKSFKSMYGDSIYSYYQKQRLQKANELLLTGKYSVKQAAQAVGYTNVANFTLAFKKQFNKAPENSLEENA
ncbi:helix-turn-helix transcriptional regulator [Ferruginibacter sp. SUN106]|uniref:helix-turn-helix transcriptional regulator n=1 Tax=Ferruginibacter sp. SUN106 TaxID=2978348 RepID=UPI003D36D763